VTRHRTVTFSAFLFLTILLPASALAAGGGGGHAMTLSEILWELGIKVLNVGILGFLAFKFLSKPLNEFVAQRSDKIKAELEEAQVARREAEERLAAFREKTAGVEREIEELKKKTATDIEKEKGILLEEARKAAEHVRSHARETIHLEVSKARADLHGEAVRLAAEIAEDLIRKNVSPEDQKRIFAEYVKEMEAAR
jgi:F-type H+-transporting ATPase subunit b